MFLWLGQPFAGADLTGRLIFYVITAKCINKVDVP